MEHVSNVKNRNEVFCIDWGAFKVFRLRVRALI